MCRRLEKQNNRLILLPSAGPSYIQQAWDEEHWCTISKEKIKSSYNCHIYVMIQLKYQEETW